METATNNSTSVDTANLWHHRTITGQTIVLNEATEKNWVRLSLSTQNARLTNMASKDGEEGLARIGTIAKALVVNFKKPVHYGDNRPGWFNSAGRPLLLAPRFTFYDLWQFGVTGEHGLSGFLKECDLPIETTHYQLLVATGLLLVADAVYALDHDRESFGGFLLHQAADCSEDAAMIELAARQTPSAQLEIQAMLSERGRAAGLLSGRERQKRARASQANVLAAAEKLRKQGVGERDIAAKLGPQFNVTPDHIRRVMRKTT